MAPNHPHWIIYTTGLINEFIFPDLLDKHLTEQRAAFGRPEATAMADPCANRGRCQVVYRMTLEDTEWRSVERRGAWGRSVRTGPTRHKTTPLPVAFG